MVILRSYCFYTDNEIAWQKVLASVMSESEPVLGFYLQEHQQVLMVKIQESAQTCYSSIGENTISGLHCLRKTISPTIAVSDDFYITQQCEELRSERPCSVKTDLY